MPRRKKVAAALAPPPYRGKDSPEAKRGRELRAQHDRGYPVMLMPCKPFKSGARSRRIRKHTWVRR